jgi:hypothetical protein
MTCAHGNWLNYNRLKITAKYLNKEDTLIGINNLMYKVTQLFALFNPGPTAQVVYADECILFVEVFCSDFEPIVF